MTFQSLERYETYQDLKKKCSTRVLTIRGAYQELSDID